MNLTWKPVYKHGERSVGQGKLGVSLGCSEGPTLHVGDRAVTDTQRPVHKHDRPEWLL